MRGSVVIHDDMDQGQARRDKRGMSIVLPFGDAGGGTRGAVMHMIRDEQQLEPSHGRRRQG